ncbi:MAG: zinc-dependent metalloprotease [Bacteroidota bacterium]|nr:zinc-dependent metalloprotease [Bacteroidota bacterium]
MRLLIICLLILFCFFSISFAKENPKKKDSKKDTSSVVTKPPKKKKSFDDSLKAFKKFDGLFKFYQDTSNGNMLMVIRKNQINKEFIYFVYAENGLPSSNTFRGSFRENRIFAIRKYYNKIEFWALNTNFYFDPKSALSKSSNGNISNSILLSQKIIDTDHELGEYLINADDIFMGEILHRIKPVPPRGLPPDAFFSLGSMSRAKSKYLKVNNYPENTDILTEYVFENPYPSVSAGAEVADDRNVHIQIQHSFIEMPVNNFKPRYDDPRIGYFTTLITEMTSPSATPYKDVIHRWHLEKKDSLSEISEPKKPIKWWLENSTPVEYRETIKKAVLQWNLAFEKCGLKNAIEVDIQPDTAKWDAGDIRYNVIRWTSSPNPIFGGYGPSFVNPRTGQILGADIMIEYQFISNRLKRESLFIPILNEQNNIHLNHFCNLAEHLQIECMYGKIANNLLKGQEVPESEFIKQAIYYLILHEVGHTLGLNHNMKASQWLSSKEIHDKEKTEKGGIIASVMDYPAVNISADKKTQGYYFTTMPGPYDDWAIEFGYRSFNVSITEKIEIVKILNRSTEKALAFGNDADDMRSPGLHIDPRVMINDLSSDAIGYMTDRIMLTNTLIGSLTDKYKKNGQSYQELNNAYQILTLELANAASVISRFVGGVYVDRSLIGQNTKNKPFTPVPYAEQKRAVKIINTHFFGTEAFKTDQKLYNYLQIQRRGFNLMGINEDPKIHERALGIQRSILDHWLHPAVLKRLTDSQLYGNKYSINEFLTDLTSSIFDEDLTKIPNSFRCQLQMEYVSRLANVVKSDNGSYDSFSKANFTAQLQSIQNKLNANKGTVSDIKVHRNYLVLLIQKALAVK